MATFAVGPAARVAEIGRMRLALLASPCARGRTETGR